jgi:hypothetical protein
VWSKALKSKGAVEAAGRELEIAVIVSAETEEPAF